MISFMFRYLRPRAPIEQEVGLGPRAVLDIVERK